MDIGGRIKAIRKDKKLTQKELGKLIGKSEISVRKYESSSNVPIDVIRDIANALDVDIAGLISDTNKLDPLDSLQGYLSDRGCYISDKDLLKEIESHILEYVKFKIYEKSKDK